MIGSFGKVYFSTSDRRVQNFIDLKRNSTARYANHEVINSKPKSEFLGPGLDTLSFSMELSVFNGVSPMGVINQFRTFIRKGKTSNFILGGRNFGQYKMTSLSEAYDIVTNRGTVMSAKVDISLEEYY